jgi:hypothetical protein
MFLKTGLILSMNLLVGRSIKKKEVRNHIAPLNYLPLLRFHPGGVRQELDEWLSPVTKLILLFGNCQLF